MNIGSASERMVDMFEVFGEMDSYKEINVLAENLREEEDTESLYKLAEENGLDREGVGLFIGYQIDEFCGPIEAALGKLAMEKKEAKGWAPLAEDIAGYVESHCDDVTFALQVRRKGKRMQEAVKRIRKAAVRVNVPGGGSCEFCGPMTGYRIIKEYYLEGAKE